MVSGHLNIIIFVLVLVLVAGIASEYTLLENLQSNNWHYQSLSASVSNLMENISFLDNFRASLELDINLTKKKLVSLNESLMENISVLKKLEEGNEYELHDPLYEEVISFIENDTSNTTIEEIRNAKMKGLRCAYVEIIIRGEGLYDVIAFNTVDNGMVYFESITDYQVVPEIGKNYTECVVGQPYILENDTITDIVIIW